MKCPVGLRTEGATFELNCHVNTHNAVYWSEGNPDITIKNERTLSDVRILGGISCRCCVGPILFGTETAAERYLNLVGNTVRPELVLSSLEDDLHCC
jgi:hypothetical protein